MDRALVWLTWLDERERKIVWARACRISYRRLAKLLRCDRERLRHDHLAALFALALKILK